MNTILSNQKILSQTVNKMNEPMQNYLGANFTNNLSSGSNITSFNATGVSLSGASNLHMATFGGWLVYHVWQQLATNDTSIILVKVSQDGGRNYSQPIVLSNHTQDPIKKSINPQVGAFGDDVYITWQGIEQNNGRDHLYIINSTDGGTSFGKAENIIKNPQANVTESSLLVDQNTGKVLVGWIDNSGANTYCGARC